MRKRQLTLFVSLLAMGVVAPAQTPSQLDRVNVVRDTDTIRVEMSAKGTINPKLSTLDSPARVVVDLPETVMATGQSRIVIEREDFEEIPPKKWFRLAPGAEVRLKGACLIRCDEVVKDASGAVVELRCTWDPASLGGDAPDGRKVKGTLHWVSAAHAVPAEVRLYDRLFTAEDPMDVPEGGDWRGTLNPASLEVLPEARLEPALADAKPGDRFQFERLGYFCADPDSRPGAPVFNRTVSLKDSWAKVEVKG